MELRNEHFLVMEYAAEGTTIFDRGLAQLLRDVQKYDDSLITIIDNMEELKGIVKSIYDENNRLAYFGAILTDKGREVLDAHNAGIRKESQPVCSKCLAFVSEEWNFCNICGTQLKEVSAP